MDITIKDLAKIFHKLNGNIKDTTIITICSHYDKKILWKGTAYNLINTKYLYDYVVVEILTDHSYDDRDTDKHIKDYDYAKIITVIPRQPKFIKFRRRLFVKYAVYK